MISSIFFTSNKWNHQTASALCCYSWFPVFQNQRHELTCTENGFSICLGHCSSELIFFYFCSLVCHHLVYILYRWHQLIHRIFLHCYLILRLHMSILFSSLGSLSLFSPFFVRIRQGFCMCSGNIFTYNITVFVQQDRWLKTSCESIVFSVNYFTWRQSLLFYIGSELWNSVFWLSGSTKICCHYFGIS